MTNQKRRDEPSGESGYRGALPTRDDSLARIWVAAVIVIFLMLFVLNFAGLPGSLLPSPTPLPSVSVPPSGSPGASGSGSASPSASVSATSTATAAPSP
jgi:hypothetical protein